MRRPVTAQIYMNGVDGTSVDTPPLASPYPPPEVLEPRDGQNTLNLIVVGHVDAGKSTTLGHLLHLTGRIEAKKMARTAHLCAQQGKVASQFAWALDEADEERSRGVTIDVAVKHIATKSHMLVMMDAPGHRDCIDNMLVGASQADVALVLIDAAPDAFEAGMRGQTKEHLLLVKFSGITQVIVAINKMDITQTPWDKDRFEEIRGDITKMLSKFGYKEGSGLAFVPVAGYPGDNVTRKSTNMPWWDGPTLLDSLELCKPVPRLIQSGSHYLISLRFCFVGAAVDLIVLWPYYDDVNDVKAISPVGGALCQAAVAGDNVEVTLDKTRAESVAVGSVVCLLKEPVVVTRLVQVQLMVIDQAPITRGFPCILHIHTTSVPCTITHLRELLDSK
eukprot:gene9230-1657_t